MKTHKAVLALSLAAMVAGVLAPAAVLADPGRHGGSGRQAAQSRTAAGTSSWVRGRASVTSPAPALPPPIRAARVPALSVCAAVLLRDGVLCAARASTARPSATTTAPHPATIRRSRTLLHPPTLPAACVRFAPARPLFDDHARGGADASQRDRVFRRGGTSFAATGSAPPTSGCGSPTLRRRPNPPPDGPRQPGLTPPPPPGPSEAPSPRRSQLYRWVDDQGVVNLTDNPESVPPQYRKPAARAQGGAS